MLCRDMTENEAVDISSNGQLTLTSVSKNHGGEWRCQATNSYGNSEAKTQLIVTSKKSMYTNTSMCCLHYICYPAKPVPSSRPDHTHKPIPVSEFGTHVNMLHQNNNQGFKAEFEVSQLATSYFVNDFINFIELYSLSSMEKACPLL